LRPKEQRHVASPQHAQPLNQPNRARYGEAAPTQLAHATNNAQAVNTNPVNVNNGEFAARFPWYVQMITRTVQQYWYTQDIAGDTPYGSQVVVTFTIHRDGSVSDIRMAQPSSSPTLNSSAVHAVQRVGSFQPLPSQYTGSTVLVGYTFTYSTPPQQ
jgi:periplasmic protein TonB